MKTILKMLAGVVVFFILIIIAVFVMTPGLTDRADEIMVQFHNGEVEAVYNESAMTNDFTLEEFETAMGIGTTYSIADATLISWGGRGFDNGEKHLYGDFEFDF